jgi:hypothetical protein
MNLTTNVKNHVLITYSDSHHFITQQQHDVLVNTPIEGMIKLEDGTIQCKNIAEILTLEKYYETYPKKRPEHYNEPDPNWKERQEAMKKESLFDQVSGNKKSREAFIRGLKKTIATLEAEGSKALNAKAHLARLESGESYHPSKVKTYSPQQGNIKITLLDGATTIRTVTVEEMNLHREGKWTHPDEIPVPVY